jgi:hypothetical protein
VVIYPKRVNRTRSDADGDQATGGDAVEIEELKSEHICGSVKIPIGESVRPRAFEKTVAASIDAAAEN